MADHVERSRRRTRSRWLIPGLVSGAAAATAVGLAIAMGAGSVGNTATPTSGATPGSATLDDAASVALSTFDSCPALLDHYRTTALPLVGPWGLGGSMYPGVLARESANLSGGPQASAEARAAAPAGSAADSSSSTGSTSETGTNVQVAGVDEADLVKRAGDLIVTVSQDPRGSSPALVVLRTPPATANHRAAVRLGRLAVGWWPTSLLVEGRTVLLIGSSPEMLATTVTKGGVADRLMPTPSIGRTRLDQIDLTDPTRPRRVRTLTVDGSVAGARSVDGVARLAITSWPRLSFENPYPIAPMPDTPTSSESSVAPDSSSGSTLAPPGTSAPTDPQAIEKQATERNTARVRASTIDDWLPHYDLTESDGTTSSGRLLDCTEVAAPAEPSGVQTLSMLTLDLRSHGLAEWQTTAVIASGSTVYATADRTYVATTSMPGGVVGGIVPRGGPTAATTAIHAFDTSGRDRGRYLASGSVTGTLLNQFSMDAHNGVLRVATTDASGFWGMPVGVAEAQPMADAAASPAASPAAPGSRVTTLRQDGERLVRIGEIDGLGRGEQIYAVRFVGPVGYVVTFRQTDPLFVLNLSDPAHPKLTGELKLPGFSAYLHPAGDGLLLGVGQDATDAGRVTGLSLSLFDVHDPTDPQRIAKVKLPQAFSDAQGDHHAFTLAGDLVLIPFQRMTSETTQGSYDAGVMAVRLTGTRLSEPTMLRMHTNGPVTNGSAGFEALMMTDTPRRTLVDDGTIWSIGAGAISGHDVSTLQRVGYTPFAG